MPKNLFPLEVVEVPEYHLIPIGQGEIKVAELSINTHGDSLIGGCEMRFFSGLSGGDSFGEFMDFLIDLDFHGRSRG